MIPVTIQLRSITVSGTAVKEDTVWTVYSGFSVASVGCRYTVICANGLKCWANVCLKEAKWVLEQVGREEKTFALDSTQSM